MDTNQLSDHLRSLGLPEPGIARVRRAFADDPGRAVRSGALNVSGIYPSRKMGCTIQFESRTMELPTIVRLEHDATILAYVDQPAGGINYQHRGVDGGATFPVQLKPDFLVLETDAVYYVDVEPEAGLRDLMAKHPGFVTQDADGRFHRPGAEAALADLRIGYRIVTERDLDPILTRNLVYLVPAFGRPAPDAATVARVRGPVLAEPGISFAALVGACGPETVCDVLAHDRIWVDLEREVLEDPEHARVYPDEASGRRLAARRTPSWAIGSGRPDILAPRVGMRLSFDGQGLELVVVGPDEVLARRADGSSIPFARTELEALWRSGALVVEVAPGDPGAALAATRAATAKLRPFTERSLEIAIRRAEVLERFERLGVLPDDVALSTARRWQADRREVERLTGDRFLGLVPVPPPANRTSRLEPLAEELMDAVIDELYLVPERRSRTYCHNDLGRRCRAVGIRVPSPKAFRKRLVQRSEHADAVRRLGRKGAYGVAPTSPIVPDAGPPDGCFPFAVGHLDATVADLELVDRRTGEPLGRPRIYRFRDGATGVTLAMLIAFEAPGRRTTLRIIRRCVRRYGRFVEQLVGDLGSEHRNLELRAIAAELGFRIAWRPASKPRFGSRLERSFGALTTELINGLAGNSQAMKNVRTVTSETDSRKRAVWDLESFTRLIEDYLEVVENSFDPRLGTTPREAFAAGLERHGARGTAPIADDDHFRFMTMPYASNGTRIIDPVEGVVVEGRSYESAEFGAAGIMGTEAEVRVDDDDVSYVMVFAGGRWIRATCRAYADLRVESESELAILSDEIRWAWSRAETERAVRGAALGKLHAGARETEADLRAGRAETAADEVPQDADEGPAPAGFTRDAGHRETAPDLYASAWDDPAEPTA